MNEKIQNYFQTAKAYVLAHKKVFSIAAPTAGVVVVLIVLAVLLIGVNNSGKTAIVYQPAKACDLLTPLKAQDLLGDKVISTDSNKPVLSINTATSKCSYTDENPDSTLMKIAAVAVRSGINDEGVQQNKMNFASSKLSSSVQAVTGVGDDAYFDPSSGQLNVLSGKNWLIFNYGTAMTPEANTLDKAIELAHKVLG